MKELLPFLGDTKTRKRLDEVFSRGMLGSVLVGAAAGKVVEKGLNLAFSDTLALLFGWSLAFVVFVGLFVYWEELEEKAKDAADAAQDAGDSGK